LHAVSFSPHLLVQRARVGSAALRRYDVRPLEAEPALVIGLALAPPRLWGYLLDCTLAGFAEGYTRPHDGRVATRIHQGLRAAQAALRGRIEGLLDHRSADVALLALACEGPLVHALGVGALSAYVCRARGVRAISTHAQRNEGMLKAEPVWSSLPVEPGDLVLAGPSAQLTEPTLERVRASGLDRSRPSVDPHEVASWLTSDESSQGAAVALFQVG
jgi:hypothetical protein